MNKQKGPLRRAFLFVCPAETGQLLPLSAGKSCAPSRCLLIAARQTTRSDMSPRAAWPAAPLCRPAYQHTTLRPALLPFPRLRLPVPLYRRYRSGTDEPVGQHCHLWHALIPDRMRPPDKETRFFPPSAIDAFAYHRQDSAVFSQHTSRGSLGQCCCPAAGQHLSEPCRKR